MGALEIGLWPYTAMGSPLPVVPPINLQEFPTPELATLFIPCKSTKVLLDSNVIHKVASEEGNFDSQSLMP